MVFVVVIIRICLKLSQSKAFKGCSQIQAAHFVRVKLKLSASVKFDLVRHIWPEIIRKVLTRAGVTRFEGTKNVVSKQSKVIG